MPSPVPYPTLPYHIHPDRSRGRNVSFPTSTLTLPYSTLPYRPNTPLPYATHLLPTFPLLYPRIPSTPLIYHILLYPPLSSPTISSLLPPPLIPSPSVPYAPISSGLPCSTQRFKTVKGQDVLVPECIGAEIVSSFGGLKWPSAWKVQETCTAETSWGRIVFGLTFTFVWQNLWGEMASM